MSPKRGFFIQEVETRRNIQPNGQNSRANEAKREEKIEKWAVKTNKIPFIEEINSENDVD